MAEPTCSRGAELSYKGNKKQDVAEPTSHARINVLFTACRMATSFAASELALDPMAHSKVILDYAEQRFEVAAQPNVDATGDKPGDILAARSEDVAAKHEVATQLDPPRQKWVRLRLLAFGATPWSLDWFSFAWALELYHRWCLR